MKIAQVTHSYLPVVGGVENYVYRLSESCQKDCMEVIILTTDIKLEKKYLENINEKNNSNVIYFHSFFTVLGNPFSFGLILHLIKNEYDIIHVHSILAIPSLISAALKKKAKFIVTSHGVSPDDNRFIIKILWNIYKPFSNFISKRADKIIVLGSKEKEKIIHLLNVDESRIDIIPNGIEIEEKPSLNVINNFKQRLNLGNFRTILFVGRVSPTKNPEILINAFKLVHHEKKNIKLAFVGPISDNYKSKLYDLAKELNIDKYVFFTGKINRDEVLAAYCCAEIFVSLGGWEGLPTTMLEAMSYGIPCIVFKSGGIEDVIQDGKNGLLVNELFTKNISEKMILILDDPDLYTKISKNAKNEVLENYKWELIYKKIKMTYIEVSKDE